jgi:hypothetical protein
MQAKAPIQQGDEKVTRDVSTQDKGSKAIRSSSSGDRESLPSNHYEFNRLIERSATARLCN